MTLFLRTRSFGRLQAEVPALQSVGARTGDGDAAELCSELVAVLR